MRSVVKIINPYNAGFFGNVLQLGSNENPYEPSENVKKAYLKSLEKINRYPDAQYNELKEKIAEYIKCSKENIAIGCGASELINRVCDCFLEELDEVLIPMPSYSLYLLYSMLRNARLLTPEFESYEISEKIAEFKPNLTFICTPNNPTGNFVKKEIVEILAERSKYLVLDEAYAEFSEKTNVNLALEKDNVIVLRSFSKFFGLAGLRIGYAVASKELVEAIEKIRLPFAVSQPALSCAIAALEDLEYYRKISKKIVAERERLKNELSFLGKIYPSEANFLLIKTDKIKALDLLKKGIAVRELPSLPGLRGYHLRITVGKKEENDLLIKVISELSNFSTN
ncbi:MAG: histidinol-phosphate transaminase [Archaeoglobaceae archaeon]|nr:histidinol-phosphate transaminase [Archaeoglobaceae archaeon]MCX8151681.1 histidinol-phosphate transaminase [Archaeoglobaceae archaeon]MDW8013041.1 histidinol-phosphate transaminase [Archaeoglobaceae archaeon]